ncbi:MAG TPA: hypothetical protein VIV60_08950 [Polyangiaceae bacterium]
MARFRISRELSIALVASIGLHVLWLAREARASSKAAPQVSEVVLETIAPPAPLKPEPPPLTPETNVPPTPVTRSTASKALASPSHALPSAAQAGKTLMAPDTNNDGAIADFTMVQGTGDAYAGGTTSSIGTSRKAVEGRASDKPIEGKRSAVDVPALAGPDRSRSATPVSPAWDCSRLYPGDADAGDYATVLIAVSVGPEGSPKRVAMLKDPGHGFGQAAIQCAMSQRFNVALDRQGNAIAATTPPIVVRFSR